jgi:hypothetical protein
MSEPNPFLCLPYIDRQQIIFVDDAVYDAENKIAAETTKEEKVSESITTKIVKTAWDIIRPTTAEIMFETIKFVVQAYQEARAKGLGLRMVPKRWISSFNLPPGHPRDAVLYIAHPAINVVYVPVADFHRFTFEHKFSEALSLLMYLGAKKIHVEHLCGWGHEFASTLSAGIPQADLKVGASAGSKSQMSQHLLYEAELEGANTPELPPDLVWYHHEPTWQKVAEGRLKFGLKKFSLKLQYKDDYGVNASLKVKAQKAGLDLGGEFQNHESTTWAINGSF